MQTRILLVIDVLLYADQATAARWKHHLMLDWYVPIDYRICLVRTALLMKTIK
jgi:hypothetical protein